MTQELEYIAVFSLSLSLSLSFSLLSLHPLSFLILSSRKGLSPSPLSPFVRFDLCGEFGTVSALTQTYIFIPQAVKHCYLVYILRSTPSPSSTIIFVSTCRAARVLSAMIHLLEMKCVELHSQMSQKDRLKAVNRCAAHLIPLSAFLRFLCFCPFYLPTS
jgi:hypothetical protein